MSSWRCPQCDEVLDSAGGLNLHVYRMHQARSAGADVGAPAEPTPTMPAPLPAPVARRPVSLRLALPLAGLVLSVLGGGVAAAVQTGRDARLARTQAAWAERIVFHRADFPADQTWNVKFEEVAADLSDDPDTGDEEDLDATMQAFARCAGIDPESSDDPIAEAEWVDGNGLEASATVEAASSPEQAHADFMAISREETWRCLADAIVGAIDAPAEVTLAPLVRRIDGLPPIGDESITYLVGTVVTGPAGTMEAAVTMSMARVGAMELSLFFAGEDTPFPDDLMRNLTTAVAGRVSSERM